MKRSPMPPRRTPMKRGAPLRSRSAKTKRREPELDAFRLALHLRSGGLCEARTPACPPFPHEGVHCHHIRRRSQGGTHDPANGLLCCVAGHSFIHANPAMSYERGWLARTEAA